MKAMKNELAWLFVASAIAIATVAGEASGTVADADTCTMLSCTIQAGWVCGHSSTGYGIDYCNLVAGGDPFDLICTLI